MKKLMIGLMIIAVLGITQTAMAEDYNSALATGWRLESAVAKKTVTVYTGFSGTSSSATDDPLDAWTSVLMIAGEISLFGPDEDMNLSLFGEWGGTYLATGAESPIAPELRDRSFTGFNDAVIGAKLQLMKSKLFTFATFLKGQLPLGREELSINDYVPVDLGFSFASALLASNLVSVGVQGTVDFNMIFATEDDDPNHFNFHALIEAWALLGEKFMVVRAGLEFDYLTADSTDTVAGIDDQSYNIYAEMQLGMGLFLRVASPIDVDDNILQRINNIYEVGELTITLGFTMFF